MHRFFFLFLFIIWNVSLSGQDIINLKDGNEIYAKVLKIGENEVEYRKFSNLEGPIYTKNKAEIVSIKYQNGSLDNFSSKDTAKKTGSDYAVHKYMEASNIQTIEPPKMSDGTMAKVVSINGVGVFFMSRPLVKYRIVFSSGDLMSDLDIKSIFWGGLARQDVDEKIKKIVNAAYRKSGEEATPIHGVLYSGGNRAVAIQFTDFSDTMIHYALVDKIDNVDVFVFANPHNIGFSIQKEARAKSGGFTAMISYGIVSSTMEDDITKLIERLNPKKNKLDGVVYTDGKKGYGIVYKKTP